MVGNNGVNPFNGQQPIYKQVKLGLPSQVGQFGQGVIPDQQTFGMDMYAPQQFLGGQQPQLLQSGMATGGFPQGALVGGGQMPGAQSMSGGYPSMMCGGYQPPISASILNCMAEISSMMASVTSQLTQFIQILMSKAGSNKGGLPGTTETTPGTSETTPETSETTPGTEETESETEEPTGASPFDKKVAQAGFDVLNGDSDPISFKGMEDGKETEMERSAFEILDSDGDGVITKEDLAEYQDLIKGKKPDKKEQPGRYNDYQAAKALEKELNKGSGDAKKFIKGLSDNLEVLSVTERDDADSSDSGDDLQYNGLTETDISTLSDQLSEGKSIEEIVKETAASVAEDESDETLKDPAKLKEWVAGQVTTDSKETRQFNRSVKNALNKLFDGKKGAEAIDGATKDEKISEAEFKKWLESEEMNLDSDVQAELEANFEHIANLKTKDGAIDKEDLKKLKSSFKSGMSLKQALRRAGSDYTEPGEEGKVNSDAKSSLDEANKILKNLGSSAKGTDPLTDKNCEGTSLADPRTRHMIEVAMGLDHPLQVRDLITLAKGEGGLKYYDIFSDKDVNGQSFQQIYDAGLKRQKALTSVLGKIKDKVSADGPYDFTKMTEDGLNEDEKLALQYLKKHQNWDNMDGQASTSVTKDEVNATIAALRRGITINTLSSHLNNKENLWKKVYNWTGTNLGITTDYQENIPGL